MDMVKRVKLIHRTFLMCILILSTLLAASALADDHTGSKNITYKSTQIAKNIWVFQGEGGFTGGNILLSSGVDGVIMVDDGLPKFFDLLNQQVSSTVGKPVDYILNTHLHGDHTGNNTAFSQSGSHVIAHQNVREQMLKNTGDKGQLPVFTFKEQFNAHLNGHDLQAIHVAHAHTNGDSFIHFPALNIIHTGDIFFNGLFPFIDLDNGGSVKGYIAAQETILSRANEQTQIVPGHGPLASKADLQKANAMLKDAASIVQALINAGKSKEAVLAANPLALYHNDWNWGFITTQKITATLYDSLSSSHKHSAHNHAH